MRNFPLSVPKSLSLVTAVTCLAILSVAARAGSEPVGVTAGKSYGEWAAAWWSWMLSIPAEHNPQDLQGEVDCSLRQSGPVWFLAGGDTGVPAVRSCDVPTGTNLFFPVLNLLVYNNPGEALSIPEKQLLLDDFFDGRADGDGTEISGPRPCDLFATIDGQPVARFTPNARIQSPPFEIDTGDGPFGFPAGLVDREALSGGFWVMLPRLSPGRHTLRFGGRICRAGSLDDHEAFGPIDVTYYLNVVGVDRIWARDSDGDSDSDSDSDRDNVAIIEDLYAAFAAGDLDTILAVIDEDVVWIESEGIPYGGTFIGRDAVFEGVFGKIAEEWDGFTATVDETFAAQGDRVIVRQRDGGTFKATGKSMEAPAISIWTLEDGRVVEFLQVIDTQEVVSATRP